MKKFIQTPKNNVKTCVASFEFSGYEATKKQDNELIKIIDELTNGTVRIEWHGEHIQAVNNSHSYEVELKDYTLYLYKTECRDSYWKVSECITSNC